MKKIFFSLIMLSIFGLSVNAQTNVSGGIYSSTTWTLAGSPYIVTDTVVVFPGVTLTIQPGVTVKFDNAVQLEIRQAKIIAVGTSTDSITFTSNSSSPTPGSWSQIYLNGGNLQPIFKYCNFKYATTAIMDVQAHLDTLILKNSNFKNNYTGLYFGGFSLIDTSNFFNNAYGIDIFWGNINYCNFFNNQIGLDVDYSSTGEQSTIKNCIFEFNQTGINNLNVSTVDNCFIKHNHYGIMDDNDGYSSYIKNSIIDSNGVALNVSYRDTVTNCQIKFNNTGINDSLNYTNVPNVIFKNDIENNKIGIIFSDATEQVYCNNICNNTTYNFYYNVDFGSNISIPNNYWCTSDSATVRASIYDGYVNINKGLVFYMPIDTIECGVTIGIVEPSFLIESNISIYPNPATDNLTIQAPPPATIEITNVEGQVIEQQATNIETTNLDVSALAKGMYFVKVKTEKGVAVKKFVKE